MKNVRYIIEPFDIKSRLCSSTGMGLMHDLCLIPGYVENAFGSWSIKCISGYIVWEKSSGQEFIYLSQMSKLHHLIEIIQLRQCGFDYLR